MPRAHPYTDDGLQIDVENGDEWVEIGECGLAGAHVLRGAGLDGQWTGLAMGLGLDRLLMLRKGIADIRLLARHRRARRRTDARSLALPAGVEPTRGRARSLDRGGRR